MTLAVLVWMHYANQDGKCSLQAVYKTRKLSYRKDNRAMRPM